MTESKLPTEGLRSKSWDEFAQAGAPEFDFVFTVCDNAAGEVCPVWPGQPITAHWGIPDPAAVTGTDAQKHAAFMDAFSTLERRISLFISLPLRSLDRLSLAQNVLDIGKASRNAARAIGSTPQQSVYLALPPAWHWPPW